MLGQTSSYWLEAVAVAGMVRRLVALETVFEVVAKAVVGRVWLVAMLETVVKEMGLQSCPPMHLHRPQHYDAMGNEELD